MRVGALLLAGLGLAALLAAGCGSSARPRPDSAEPRIVFVSTREGDYAIFSMNADGSREQRLTPDEKGDGSSPEKLFFQIDPAWSPDGRSIAFASKRDGRFHIFVMQADGTATRRLTSSELEDGHPTWSPGGRRIAFSRGAVGDIYVMAADGTGPRRLGEDAADERQPAWSPDGRWIAYIRRESASLPFEIWLMRPDGSERRRLTNLRANSYSPAWSPDGRRLAFASNARGGLFEIYTIGVDGKGLRRLTYSITDAFEPAWSPDGESIAFSRGGSISVRDSAGNEVVLTESENNDSSPVWQPSVPGEGG